MIQVNNKSKAVYLCIVLICFFSTKNSFGQFTTVKGEILEKATMSPIKHAEIVVKAYPLQTFKTNYRGHFTLIIPDSLLELKLLSLKVSIPGFPAKPVVKINPNRSFIQLKIPIPNWNKKNIDKSKVEIVPQVVKDKLKADSSQKVPPANDGSSVKNETISPPNFSAKSFLLNDSLKKITNQLLLAEQQLDSHNLFLDEIYTWNIELAEINTEVTELRIATTNELANFELIKERVLALEDRILQLEAVIQNKENDFIFLTDPQKHNLKILQEQLTNTKARLHELLKIVEHNNQELVVVEKSISFSVITIAIILFIACGILLFLIARLKKQKETIKATNKQLLVVTENLKEAIEQKEMLMKEIHHRIKNNLQQITSLLFLQSSMINDVKAKDALDASRKRIETIAIIHKQFYSTDNVGEANMTTYLNKLCQSIDGIYQTTDKKIEWKLNIDPIVLNLDTALSIGLIIHELVSNSFKHSVNINPLIININFNNNEGRLCLKVKDNGPGLKEDFDFQKSDSLGLKLINMLSRQLQGDFSFINDDGTLFLLKFSPISERHSK